MKVSLSGQFRENTDYIVVVAMFLLLWATLGEKRYLWLSFFWLLLGMFLIDGSTVVLLIT